MQRVLVIGSAGSGKSTISRRIAERTRLPLVHLDAQYWSAGWNAMPKDEWDLRVAQLLSEGSWIIDGNYGRTMPARLAACDTVIFLDVPRLTCLWRIAKRRIQYNGRNRPDLPEGCPEQISWEFIFWVWNYPRRSRPGVVARLNALGDEKRIVILRNNADIDAFVNAL